jgi:hypothetical protein
MLHRRQAEQKLFVMNSNHPDIRFTVESLITIEQAVQQNGLEITLYGFVDELNGSYVIRDVFIPKQEVSGASVDVSSSTRLDILQWMLDTRPGDRCKMRFWCHSHVHMDVSPSGVDKDDCMKSIKEQGGGYFIRAIANKKGEMSVALYDSSKNIYIEDCDWSMDIGGLESQIAEKVKSDIEKNVLGKSYNCTGVTNLSVDDSGQYEWAWARNRNQENLFDTTPKLDAPTKEDKFHTFEFKGVELVA